jgi:hypothetical protein
MKKDGSGRAGMCWFSGGARPKKAGKRFHIADELSIGISKCKKRFRVGILGDGVIWI